MRITNRVTEKDLRDYLSTDGYYGRSARIHELELVAVQRPGWVQVFRVQVEAKHEETGWTELFGVIRDDERNGFEAQMFSNPADRDAAMSRLSEGLIQLSNERSVAANVLALSVLGGLVLLAAIALFGQQ